MARFLIVFILWMVVLFTLDVLEPVERYFIAPFTAGITSVTAFLLGVFDSTITAHGNILADRVTGAGIAIVRGCTGIEAMILLVSAMLAWPASWRQRLSGIAGGIVAIQVLNLVRIGSLYYLNRWDHDWFEWFHLYVWQALIVLDALVVFLVWLRFVPDRTRPGAA